MATQRKAEVVWKGNLLEGSGTIVAATSDALPPLAVSWPSRAEEPAGKTSPEELLAAAHASDFAMQFTSGLVGAGWEPEEMHVSCTVTFEGRLGIIESALTARVTVPGPTDDQIYELADRAKITWGRSRGRSRAST